MGAPVAVVQARKKRMPKTVETEHEGEVGEQETQEEAQEEEEEGEGDEGEAEEGDEETEEEEEVKIAPKKRKTVSQPASSAVFDAGTDAFCIKVREYLGRSTPVTAITKTATFVYEGDEVEIGKMLFDFRSKYRSERCSSVTRARGAALGDIEQFQKFLDEQPRRSNGGGGGGGASSSASSLKSQKKIQCICARANELIEVALKKQVVVCERRTEISKQELAIFSLQENITLPKKKKKRSSATTSS